MARCFNCCSGYQCFVRRGKLNWKSSTILHWWNWFVLYNLHNDGSATSIENTPPSVNACLYLLPYWWMPLLHTERDSISKWSFVAFILWLLLLQQQVICVIHVWRLQRGLYWYSYWLHLSSSRGELLPGILTYYSHVNSSSATMGVNTYVGER